jgi:hypothetical protein
VRLDIHVTGDLPVIGSGERERNLATAESLQSCRCLTIQLLPVVADKFGPQPRGPLAENVY